MQQQNNKFSHLFGSPEQEPTVPDIKKEQQFAASTVPKEEAVSETRPDYQQIDGISYYKQASLFILLKAHVSHGTPMQAIFDSDKQDL
jgi:hypothetical protein